MNRRAFTLIKLLVVVAIIGILAEDNLMDSKVAIC
jgi:prepilin-type N-terminal cleavage/methylation domain-containing protein